MSEFRAILVAGLFHTQDGVLHIEQDGGEHVSLDTVLSPVVGERVQLALHHLPPHGIQPSEPGAGCCRFPGGKGCPVQHDQNPDRLLSFCKEGVLRRGPWRLEQSDGSVSVLPLAGMPGHYGRVGAATVVDLAEMREQMVQPDLEKMADTIAASGVSAEGLAAILAKLRGGQG